MKYWINILLNKYKLGSNLFFVEIFYWFYLRNSFKKGMFIDGVTYAAISRNMSLDFGSIWAPHYTKTLYPVFYEHLPFALWIQSLFFRLLGDHYWIERMYGIIMLLLTSFILYLIWILLEQRIQDVWILLLFWLLHPLTIWSYNNNILEITMTLFCVLSVYFYILFIQKNTLLYLLMASSCTVMAFFSKGLVGLFPLISAGVYYIFFPSRVATSRAKIAIILSILFPLIILATTLFYSPIKDFYSNYINGQMIETLLHHRDITTQNRCSILVQMIFENGIGVGCLIVVWFFNKRKLKRSFSDFFPLIIALAASLPLIISLKQHNYYLLTSSPFYAIFFSLIMVKNMDFNRFRTYFSQKWIGIVHGIIMVFFIAIHSKESAYYRDELLIKQINSWIDIAPAGSTISTTWDNCNNWTLVAYVNRIGRYSLDCSDTKRKYSLNETLHQ